MRDALLAQVRQGWRIASLLHTPSNPTLHHSNPTLHHLFSLTLPQPLPQAGRPVCIERTGRIQSKKLGTVTKSLVTSDEPSPLFTAHLHSVEVGRALARFNDANRPRDAPEISQVLVIMDVKGLGMHTLYPPALTLLKINGACKPQTANPNPKIKTQNPKP